MYLDALVFLKVAMEYPTQQVYRVQFPHVQQNRGFAKPVVLVLQILCVNYVQIQVMLLSWMRSGD
jgi:hypothetical protein